MLTLISYDIVSDRQRTKVMKVLLGYGTRVQYSVFEADLSPQQLATIRRTVAGLINLNTDSVRCYLLDVTAVGRIQIIGIGQVTVQEPFVLVGT